MRWVPSSPVPGLAGLPPDFSASMCTPGSIGLPWDCPRMPSRVLSVSEVLGRWRLTRQGIRRLGGSPQSFMRCEGEPRARASAAGAAALATAARAVPQCLQREPGFTSHLLAREQTPRPRRHDSVTQGHTMHVRLFRFFFFNLTRLFYSRVSFLQEKTQGQERRPQWRRTMAREMSLWWP